MPSAIPSTTGVAAPAGQPQPGAAERLRTIRIGLVGCGAFARFSMAQYRRLPGVAINAVADVDPAALLQA